MRIYWRNNPAKFQPDPFENMDPKAFLKSVALTRGRRKTTTTTTATTTTTTTTTR